MRLQGRVAVITGGASGIGRAAAGLFAREGAACVVADIDADRGQDTVGNIEGAGGQAIFQQTDVTRDADVHALMAAAVERFGRLDVLYNNAGIPQAFTPIEEVTEDFWDKVMDVNAKSVFLGCKHAVPVMKQQGGGSIIVTASTAAVRPRPGLNAYCASKGAVVALVKALALEVAADNIRVNCIHPVATDSPMLPGFMGQVDEAQGREAFVKTIPLGRLARPEDIAYGALYLASDEAAMVTGTCLEIDGGRCV